MNRTAIFVAMACALLATPALADLVLKYDMGSARLTYTVATKTLVVSETLGSTLELRAADDVTGIVADNALVSAGAFNFELQLTLSDLAGANNWSGTGSMVFTDTDTSTNAVEADVQTFRIERIGTALEIEGNLSGLGAATGILVNRGSPWVFVGDSEIAGETAAVPANQLALVQPASYDSGQVLTVRFGMPAGGLDTLFASNQNLTGGYVGGAIVPVPVPAAVLLGFLGLGAAGLKLRRFA